MYHILKTFFLNLLLCYSLLSVSSVIQAQTVKICTWNIEDLGKSKSEEEINFMAQTLQGCDIVAIQEVVAGEGGEDAVKRLFRALNHTGLIWDYSLSLPTTTFISNCKSERYVFFWKRGRVNLRNAWLEKQYYREIEREPYLATFRCGNTEFTLVTFHAITKAQQPETEVKYFRYFLQEYPGLKLIFMGDFNLPQSHSVFNPLKSYGYVPVLTGQKTSLRQKCLTDGCLASEYDNIFINRNDFNFNQPGVIHFYESFTTIQEARKISDHIPVFVSLNGK